MPSAAIGIIGGSGLYSFMDDVEEVSVDTPYGPPSDVLTRAVYKGKTVVFLPRHGRKHTIPPHMINYRANIWALKQLGVKFVISPSAAGSLRSAIKPGDFVVADQFIDRTSGRKDTFYDEPVTHISSAAPYCDYLRDIAVNAVAGHAISHHPKGTVVVIQGPRFSSVAESRWFSAMGGDVVNMTQYPEVVLARELEMSFVNIAVITDYDVGVEGVTPVPVTEMVGLFKQNMEKLNNVLFTMIETIELNKETSAHSALKSARF